MPVIEPEGVSVAQDSVRRADFAEHDVEALKEHAPMEFVFGGAGEGEILFEGFQRNGLAGIAYWIAEGAEIVDGGGVGDGADEGKYGMGMVGPDAAKDLKVVGAELEVDVLNEVVDIGAVGQAGSGGGAYDSGHDEFVKSRKKAIPSVAFPSLRRR